MVFRNSNMIPCCMLAVFLCAAFLFSCERPAPGDQDFIIAGETEGMLHQVFDPPMSISFSSVHRIAVIYPDPSGEDSIQFNIYYSGPTGCRNLVDEVILTAADNISFLYHYDAHTEYYFSEWKEYLASNHTVEKYYVLEIWRWFTETDSVLGIKGIDVISAFREGDTIRNEGNFREGGTLLYEYGSQISYSLSPHPWVACRIEPDSSYVHNDTVISYFTYPNYYYIFDEELYDPEGAYIVFKYNTNSGERLGWIRILTDGSSASIYECALQQ
jgi:hypothetical protein